MSSPVESPLRPSRLAPLLQPLQAFLAAESAGGILLMGCALVALVWANSPWGDSYQHFWHAELSVAFAGRALEMSLEHWVNDGLMVIFFLLVGLEIKREVLIGELASLRRAVLPMAAAIGGMVVPAAIYFALNRGGPGAPGWGVPMATDIAFAIGVLALVGRSVPLAIKVFLLAIAIVDDLGAVLVIAIFYTHTLSTVALGVAGAFLVALIALNILRVHRPLPYMLLGLGLWAATLFSGIHATVAGVLLAFTIPASRPLQEGPYVDYMRKMLAWFERDVTAVPDLITADQSHALHAMEEASQGVQAPLGRVEHVLVRPVAFFIVPIFALANAGVDLRGGGMSAIGSPISWGVFIGLVAGKPLGILLMSWLVLVTRVATMPEGATVRHIIGVSLLCGIGFTMSLFVANLAFPLQPEHLVACKVGILLASVVAGLAGGVILARPGRADSSGNG